MNKQLSSHIPEAQVITTIEIVYFFYFRTEIMVLSIKLLNSIKLEICLPEKKHELPLSATF